MKEDWTHLDQWRQKGHPSLQDTQPGDHRGVFEIPANDRRDRLQRQTHFCVIASDGEFSDWEHVSIHVRYRDGIDKKMRTPRWDEMCYVKNLFWDVNECVVQFHPKEASYVNVHQHVLHLWRSTTQAFPEPPTIFV